MGVGEGYGKTILIGDQFVVQGIPAIVSSISYKTIAVVEKIEGKGWSLDDRRTEVPGYKKSKEKQQVESINRILDVMKIDTEKQGLKITFNGDLLAGSGVGASAASCVSLARALNDEFGLGLPIERINEIAWEGEFAYHGIPSGVDNTASCYGGLMFFQLKNREKTFERIEVKKPIDIVLGNSGVSANTALLDSLVEKQRENDPDLFESRMKKITRQVEEVRKALLEFDLEKVGSIMTENHGILIDMGLSHPKLIQLCNLALENGALGAKLTGGGMGGFMIALVPDREIQERVSALMEAGGFYTIKATIGGS
ncbi:MAG: mevalonate kinase [Spirochaetes bacterium]|nr:MAG: mevalonate kinase [Spirochaetota bacterium]